MVKLQTFWYFKSCNLFVGFSQKYRLCVFFLFLLMLGANDVFGLIEACNNKNLNEECAQVLDLFLLPQHDFNG